MPTNRRPGRPPYKRKSDKQIALLRCYATPAEARVIKAAAAQGNVSVSHWLRALALNQIDREREIQ